MQHNVGALTNLPYGDTGEDDGLRDGLDPLLLLDRNSFSPFLNMNGLGLVFSIGKNNQKLVYVASTNIHLTPCPPSISTNFSWAKSHNFFIMQKSKFTEI